MLPGHSSSTHTHTHTPAQTVSVAQSQPFDLLVSPWLIHFESWPQKVITFCSWVPPGATEQLPKRWTGLEQHFDQAEIKPRAVTFSESTEAFQQLKSYQGSVL